MQLSQLQLDLHPRPNAQALDLGFALLRANWRAVYLSWLALWLPLVGLCFVIALWQPRFGAASLVLAWWLRPLLERAPLYVLSRQVFGEHVHWLDALRAWPKQLGGGWFRLLTWWRLFVPSRGLYQAIWQLEGARGKVAANRRSVIGNRTASSAYWFGIACANFELILQLGLYAFIGLFVTDEASINPLRFFAQSVKGEQTTLVSALTCLTYAFSVGIIAPIYVACCFTLYLNRRASIEAWDIEIMLRQMKVPKQEPASSTNTIPKVFLCLPFALLLFSAMFGVPDAQASSALAVSSPPVASQKPANRAANNLAKCKAPEPTAQTGEWAVRSDDHSPQQQQIRADLDDILASEDLIDHTCVQRWFAKNKSPNKTDVAGKTPPDLNGLATFFKVLLTVTAIFFVFWILLRFRNQFQFSSTPKSIFNATEIAGLDIRPESLPADVIATVRELWQAGNSRAAIALLYRATLSRLVSLHEINIHRGATEGDCLRLAEKQFQQQSAGNSEINSQANSAPISVACLEVTRQTTTLWQQGAYAHRWPTEIDVICQQWQQVFAV